MMMGEHEVTNSERYEIRFSGAGGQGLITAAVIFARAVGEFDGKYVCQTQSYGPEARGGKSQAEVVISNHPIDYPKALSLNMLLAMNQASCDAYFFDLKPDGLLVVDSSLVEQYPTSRIIGIPFTTIARDEVGLELTANMVALGAVGLLSGRVTMESLEKAVLAGVPAGTTDINKKALRLGVERAAQVDLHSLPRELVGEEDDV